MKMRFLVAMSILLPLFMGCVNDIDNPIGSNMKEVGFTAVIEGNGVSRSNVTDEGDFTWTEGDLVAAYVSGGSDLGFDKFSLTSGANTSKGCFKGVIGDDEKLSGYAVYPYNERHLLTDGHLAICMPEEYGDFDTEYSPDVNAPMVAVVPESYDEEELALDFHHVGGVIRFMIENVPADAAQFLFATDTGVTGTFDVTEEDGHKIIRPAEITDGNNTVRINFKPNGKLRTMIFYVPLPVGTYEGFSISINDKDGNRLDGYETGATNTLGRKMLVRYPRITLNPSSDMECVPGEHTIMYDESMTKYFIEVGEDYFVMNNTISDDLVPEKGKIICCPITEQTPFGFMGKVTEVVSDAGGIRVKCEAVALDEAFSTLKINTSINLSEYVEEVVDENGEVIEHTVVSSVVLDSLAMNPDAVDSLMVETKAAANISRCLKLKLTNNLLSGSLYLKYSLNINIDIAPYKQPVADFSLETETGVEGELNVKSLEGEKEFPLLKIKVPTGVVAIGAPFPVMIFRPTINSKVYFCVEGEVAVKSSFKYVVEHTLYELGYSGEWDDNITNLLNKDDNYFKLASIELDGSFGLKTSLGLELGLWSSKVAGLGFAAETGLMANVNIPFYMTLENLLDTDPMLTFSLTRALEVYCEASFLGKSLGKHEARLELEPIPIEIPILPKFKELSGSLSNDTVHSTVELTSKSVLETEEEGIVLLKDKDVESAIEYVGLKGGSVTESKSATFKVKNGGNNEVDKKYYVAPYIKHDKKYYYGKPVLVAAGLRDQLIQFYKDTGGDNWTNNDNWCTDEPLEKWYGISKDYETGLYAISLNNNNLVGNPTLNHSEILRVDVANNRLASLNLMECSSLESIECNGNPCNAIYFTGCSNLKELHFQSYHYNDIRTLATLDVSGCTALEVLFVENNKLSTLLLDGCTSLQSIDCHGNELTTLDVSGLPSLKKVSCSHNKLQSIDISGCSLKSLYCSDNNISREISGDFAKIPTFVHDQRYTDYWWEEIYNDEGDLIKRILHYTDNGKGWWYPGEPDRGYH